jgi:hypothetical protein
MGRVQPATTGAVFDLYLLLSEDGRREFLRRLANISDAPVLFQFFRDMTVPERVRFSEMVSGTLARDLLPLLVKQAVEIARADPHISDEEFARRIEADSMRTLDRNNASLLAIDRAQVKEKRDRKSDPETIRRNVEICDLRKQDPKKWSYRRLARQFKITPQAIGLILKGETKWRRLAGGAT